MPYGAEAMGKTAGEPVDEIDATCRAKQLCYKVIYLTKAVCGWSINIFLFDVKLDGITLSGEVWTDVASDTG